MREKIGANEVLMVDNRREENRIPREFHSKIDALTLFEGTSGLLKITPETLRNKRLAIIRGGDGTTAYLLNMRYLAQKLYGDEETDISFLHEGGGSANTLLNGLMRQEKAEIPNSLKEVFPSNLYEARRYFPLQGEYSAKIAHFAYLVGLGHLTVEITKKKEDYAKKHGKIEDLSKVYIQGGIESLRSLKKRVEPLRVSFRDGSNVSHEQGLLAASEIITVPRLGTFNFKELIPDEKIRLLTVAAKSEAGLFYKFLVTLLVGGNFSDGADRLIRMGILKSRDVDTVTAIPDRRKKHVGEDNVCFDGELRRVESEMKLQRSSMAVTFIIPRQLVRDFKGGFS